jgi:AraC-like DNA-binding protein
MHECSHLRFAVVSIAGCHFDLYDITSIVKTRQSMSRSTAPPARGVLKAPPMKGEHYRWLPNDALSPLVEHFWFVSWDTEGKSPQTVATLPHPSVHMVFESGVGAEIAGVYTKRFVRELRDKGEVFGIKFKPGGFHPFYKRDLIHLRNRRVPIESVFGVEGVELGNQISACSSNEARMQLAEQFLTKHAPTKDEPTRLIADFFEVLMRDKSITSLNQVCSQLDIGMRQLQRLFTRYVGVTPKWVIQRYRLHEALIHVHQDNKPDWAQLADQLGYNDQAHFIKNFKDQIGMTPEQYWKSQDSVS